MCAVVSQVFCIAMEIGQWPKLLYTVLCHNGISLTSGLKTYGQTLELCFEMFTPLCQRLGEWVMMHRLGVHAIQQPLSRASSGDDYGRDGREGYNTVDSENMRCVYVYPPRRVAHTCWRLVGEIWLELEADDSRLPTDSVRRGGIPTRLNLDYPRGLRASVGQRKTIFEMGLCLNPRLLARIVFVANDLRLGRIGEAREGDRCPPITSLVSPLHPNTRVRRSLPVWAASLSSLHPPRLTAVKIFSQFQVNPPHHSFEPHPSQLLSLGQKDLQNTLWMYRIGTGILCIARTNWSTTYMKLDRDPLLLRYYIQMIPQNETDLVNHLLDAHIGSPQE